ncbi:MAG: AMP-dependent synthetase/ligase [Planctomycetaceae bacterium]
MPSNLASMHRAACERFGPRAALRFKRFGRYEDLSYSEYRRLADGAAAGLIELGIVPGDRVALFSENRFEWLVADHAILSAGAVNVPLHAPLTGPQAAYQIGHSDARGVIIGHQAQADKIAAVLDQLPHLEFLISFEPVQFPSRLTHWTFPGLIHRGWQQGEAGRSEILRREAARSEDSLATIIYTSGTTGIPKGVMLTHGNLLSNALTTACVHETEPGDVQLSWLPFSHIYARTVDHYFSSATGATLALADSVDTLLVNLAETHPAWMNAVPRFYEKVWASVEHLPLPERATRLRGIFGPRLRYVSSGGAPLPKHTGAGLTECGIPVYEGYGLTESSPVISFNSPGTAKLGTVGRALPGVEVQIAPDGEILTRGPHVMKGYWKNPEATAETIVDGWLKTGDVGTLDADGYLSITDRKKDLIITSGGKNIAPSELEHLLVSDPFIDQAVVYGDRRPFVTAIVVPALANLEAHCQASGWQLDTADGFIRNEAVLTFYGERIENLMKSVSQPERVKKFLLLARAFQLADEELTATLKVRRRHIVSRFEPQLAALYEPDLHADRCLVVP